MKKNIGGMGVGYSTKYLFLPLIKFRLLASFVRLTKGDMRNKKTNSGNLIIECHHAHPYSVHINYLHKTAKIFTLLKFEEHNQAHMQRKHSTIIYVFR